MILLLATAFADTPPTWSPAVEAFVAELQQDRMVVAPDRIDALHTAACEAGYRPSCDRTWTTGDLRGAANALRPSCAEDDPIACLVDGWSQSQSEPGRIHEDLKGGEAAAALLDKACKLGVERGCVDRGVLLTRGLEGKPGLDEAHGIFQTACQVGELSGCRRLGALYHSGRGFTRDLDKARTLYTKACEGGHAPGCNGIGLLDHLGVGTAKKPLAAEAAYKKACDAGHTGACGNLEKLYRNGVDPREDPEGALAIWTSGCDRGIPAACANAGRLAADADLRGDDADSAAATDLLERGCNLGDPFTCGLLGDHVLTSDTTRGTSLLEMACAQGVSPSCASLAHALWIGEVLPKDKKRAKKLFSTACTDGYAPACDRQR